MKKLCAAQAYRVDILVDIEQGFRKNSLVLVRENIKNAVGGIGIQYPAP